MFALFSALRRFFFIIAQIVENMILMQHSEKVMAAA